MTPKTMDKVAMVARIAEQASIRELSVKQQRHQQKDAQLEQLLQFKREYEEKLDQVTGSGIGAKQLQDYRLFMHKLNQAIVQHRRELEIAAADMGLARAQWLSKSQRKSALDHLVEQAHRAQLAAHDKAEQKAADENTLARTISRREE